MSRTKKGAKGPGYEYWGRKYNGDGKHLNSPGKLAKRYANRRDRRKAKKEAA